MRHSEVYCFDQIPRPSKVHKITAKKFPFLFSESTLSEQGELKPLSTSPEHQGSQGSPSPSPQSSNFQPIMSILGGVATALVLVTVVIIVTMRLRCSGLRHNHTPNSSLDHTWKLDSGC